jgi:hypothetical protein
MFHFRSFLSSFIISRDEFHGEITETEGDVSKKNSFLNEALNLLLFGSINSTYLKEKK